MNISPDTPGGGYILLHHVRRSLAEGGEHCMCAHPEGGTGPDALAASAREAGGRYRHRSDASVHLALFRMPSQRVAENGMAVMVSISQMTGASFMQTKC